MIARFTRCSYCLEPVDIIGSAFLHKAETVLARVHTRGYGWHTGDRVPPALFNLSPEVNDGCCVPWKHLDILVRVYEASI